MKLKHALLAATFACASSAPAYADVVLLTGNLADLEAVHSAGTQSGTTVYGTVAGQQVSFVSTSTLGVTGSGVAKIEGPFSDLEVFLTTPAAAFEAINFSLFDAAASKAAPVLVDITAFLVGGGSTTFDDVALTGNLSKFLIKGDAGEVFSKISFSTSGEVDDIRQVDLSPIASPIPEPATWAVMILGFVGLGAGLRANRRTLRPDDFAS